MIQFNLLPDVKLEFVKTQHTKRLLTTVSFFVSLAGIALLLVSLFSVDVLQKKNLRDLSGDISKYSKQLNSVSDLDKILTVQNQLSTLTQLHDQKPVASRLFSYISQVTPSQASLNQLTVDFTANKMTVGGNAPSLDVVSTYTDTLKGTLFNGGPKPKAHAFTNVVLATFGRSQAGATFTITFDFDPVIFNSADDITLTVPQSADANQTLVFGGDS